jgi:hypothetical protein
MNAFGVDGRREAFRRHSEACGFSVATAVESGAQRAIDDG